MFCIKCGSEYQIEQLQVGRSKFCKNCGELLYSSQNSTYNHEDINQYQSENTIYTPFNTGNSNTALYVLISIIIVILLSVGGWYYYNQKPYTEIAIEQTTEATVDSTHLIITTPNTPVADTARFDDEIESEQDIQNTNVTTEYLDDDYFKYNIQLYYETEKLRNFDDLYKLYLSNLEQYYDLTYPSYEQLLKRFNATWNVTTDVTNTIKTYNINRFDNSIQVEIVLDYTYYGLKIQQYKTVNDIKVIFNFDSHGKIKNIYN